jgi:hypothetical protein
MLAVSDQCGALEAATAAQPHLGCDLVAEEADHSGGGERPEVGQMFWVDKALDRLVEGNAGEMKMAATTNRPASFSAR